MPTFPPLPLGQPIPPSPHALSCSLPTMREVRGYEERDPETLIQLTSGYPGFVVHPIARQLAEHLVATNAVLRGRTLWLTSSAAMAERLLTQLSGQGAERFSRDGINGVSHPSSVETFT